MKKLKNKIYLLFFVAATLLLLTLACSATDDTWEAPTEYVPNESVFLNSASANLYACSLTHAASNTTDVMLFVNQKSYFFLNPTSFKLLVNNVLETDNATYEAWYAFCSAHNDNTYCSSWVDSLTEADFNYYYTYDMSRHNLYSLFSYNNDFNGSITKTTYTMIYGTYYLWSCLNSDTGVYNYLINPMTFRTYVDTASHSHGNLTYSSWLKSCSSATSGFLHAWKTGLYDEIDYNFYYYGIRDITEDDLIAEYDNGYNEGFEYGYDRGYSQGKIDGAAEYKESEEYTNTLSSKYDEGFASGRELGTSEGYSQGKTDGAVEALANFNDGLVYYLTEFKASSDDLSLTAFWSYLMTQDNDFYNLYEEYITYDSIIDKIYDLGCEFGLEAGINNVNSLLKTDYGVYINQCNTNGTTPTVQGFIDFVTELGDSDYFNTGVFETIKKLVVIETGATGSTEEGITAAHDFVSSWLEEHDVLFEPIYADGTLEKLEMLLNDNVVSAFEVYRQNGYNVGLNEGKDIGKTNGINASIVQVRDWLKTNNHLWLEESFYTPQGDITLIDKMLNQNIPESLSNWRDSGYTAGYNQGLSDGSGATHTSCKIEVYNDWIDSVNTAFGTEYPEAKTTTFDYSVASQAYDVAYKAGEVYQINKLTDDGGISDFLADISGTVLSSFFYLGNNISFMGTTLLSLISLVVIAAIVIFILKFFNKG